MRQDDFGSDPQVRYLRRIFSNIEKTQDQFLRHLNISPFDERLRRWRDAALKLFEKAWTLAARRGISTDEQSVSKIYLHCLAHFLKLNRIDVSAVSSEILPADEDIGSLIREALK